MNFLDDDKEDDMMITEDSGHEIVDVQGITSNSLDEEH